MPEVLAIVIVVIALAVCVWLSVQAQSQVRQLRADVDASQRMLNAAGAQHTETTQQLAALQQRVDEQAERLGASQREIGDLHQQLSELKAAAEVIPPPPPPLPRSARPGGLEDLRAQLRAAHREEQEGTGPSEDPD